MLPPGERVGENENAAQRLAGKAGASHSRMPSQSEGFNVGAVPSRIFEIVMSSVPTAACAGRLQSTLVKPAFVKSGATAADFNRDRCKCERDARQAQIKNVHERQDFFDRCMITRGWTIRRTNQ